MALNYGNGGDLSVTLAGPYGAVGSAVRLGQMELPQQGWKGGDSPFFQTVEVAELTAGSKIDLLPSPQQLVWLRSRGIALTTENDSGTVTCYAIGGRPDADLSIQMTVTEVTA